MLKPKEATKLVQKQYTVNPQYHGKMIEKLVKEKGFTSASEVVRRGIQEIYEHFFPPYRQETIAGQIKLKKLEKDHLLNNATPEEYADSISAPIRTNHEGEKVAFIYFADWKEPTPINLKRLQQYSKQFPNDIEIHLNRVKNEGPLDDKLVVGKEYDSNFGFSCSIAE